MINIEKQIILIRLYYLIALLIALLLFLLTNNDIWLLPVLQIIIMLLFLIKQYPIYHENLKNHYGIYHIIIFINNIAAVYLSSGELNKSLLISIVYSSLLLVSTNRFLNDKFMLIILFTSVLNLYSSRLGFPRSLELMILLLLVNWLIPLVNSLGLGFLKNKEEVLNYNEYNTSKSIINIVYSQTVWFQIQLRRLFDYFQRTLWSSLLLYLTIYLLMTIFCIIKIPQVAFSISYILLTADISSRVTIKNIVVNPKILDRLENNLPQVQKRGMNKIIQVVSEAAAKEPVATVAVVGTVIAASLAFIANTDAIEATEKSTAATKEYTEATEKSTAATKESTNATVEYTKSQNKQWALSEYDSAVTESYKEDLEKVMKSGNMDDLNPENAIRDKIHNKSKDK